MEEHVGVFGRAHIATLESEVDPVDGVLYWELYVHPDFADEVRARLTNNAGECLAWGAPLFVKPYPYRYAFDPTAWHLIGVPANASGPRVDTSSCRTFVLPR